MSLLPIALALALAGAAAPGAQAEEAGEKPPRLVAVPASGGVELDGRLDEAAWRGALPFDAFVRHEPNPGAPPAFPTDVRVVVSGRTLYVGVRAWDPEPGRIARPLGRRDAPPLSDDVIVYVDGARDRRNARLFRITAGGVLADAVVYDDEQITYDWDAVWDGAATVDERGWTAELALPLAALRLPGGGAPVGFGIVRFVARTKERSGTFPRPAGSHGIASRLGSLGGLPRAAPGAELALSPYLAARVLVRPGADAGPRRADPISDLGLDLRARVGDLALAAAVNPDFGQVEADRIVQNLSTFETLFPEKRPFFQEGLDVFEPVGSGHETVPHRLLYSRRIGLDAPILGAVKLAGDAREGLEVGLLEAIVSPALGPEGGAGLRWAGSRPLRLAPGDLGADVPLDARNFLGGAVRWQAVPGAVLGAQAASVLSLASPCSAADAARDDEACDTLGGAAVAGDFNARTADGVWWSYGQVAASRADGGPPERTLRDGTTLHPGDLGAGAYLRAGMRRVQGLRIDGGLAYASPRFDVNPTGFQRTQNELDAHAQVRWAEPALRGAIREWKGGVTARQRVTTDGRELPRGRSVAAKVEGVVASPWLEGACELSWEDPQLDVREIAGTGIPLERPPRVSASCEVASDRARRVAWSLELKGDRSLPRGLVAATESAGVTAGLTLRPHPRLETKLEASVERERFPLRFVEEDGAGALTFGRLSAPSFSLALSHLWVLAPRLTLQAHAQLFTAYRDYGPFWSAAPDGRAPIRLGDLAPAPAPADDPDGRSVELVLNAVLRWEWRPGSTLWVVWARTQAGAEDAGTVDRTLSPRGLGDGPAVDSLLVKLSWWLAR